MSTNVVSRPKSWWRRVKDEPELHEPVVIKPRSLDVPADDGSTFQARQSLSRARSDGRLKRSWQRVTLKRG